ncbi:unnamed protein product [Lactuca saligna]|uniref:Protein RER1 n=1 Tax=Lactuca saligna TaxID=75948 RepID=A0AA35ZN59_LACSI|nr:unnamed protein product [Lactuca saligna]
MHAINISKTKKVKRQTAKRARNARQPSQPRGTDSVAHLRKIDDSLLFNALSFLISQIDPPPSFRPISPDPPSLDGFEDNFPWRESEVLIQLLKQHWINGDNIQGFSRFYIVTYGLGIYLLNLLIGFLSPLVDPEVDPTDGALLPTKGSDEFKPFIRRLPEFKFWYAITKAFIISIMMTFFSMFDVPVFWPILLCYWFVLFAMTMKRQIMHMVKYKYIPFSIGKQKYSGKRSSSAGGSRD